MQTVSKSQVLNCLTQLGIQSGDGLLVHSAIQFLGKPQGGPGMYWEALREATRCCGSDNRSGTIAVPTFNFAFARGEPYDPQVTPSQEMGVLSEYIRQLPEALRTPHPLQSLAVLGRWAADLAGRDTPSAFDPTSALDRMLALDFQLLLLGADVQAASIIHYSEQRAAVPYRYWKEFTGLVRTTAGWVTCTYKMYARDLEINPQLDLHPVQADLEARSQWRSVPLHYGHIAACRLADFVDSADRLLAADPWALVANREQALQIYTARG